MFIVVCYDTPDDRRRNKISQVLEAYGSRVQWSVFECDLTPAQLARLRKRLDRLLVEDQDSLRYYTLCAECVGKVEWRGKVQGIEQTPPFFAV